MTLCKFQLPYRYISTVAHRDCDRWLCLHITYPELVVMHNAIQNANTIQSMRNVRRIDITGNREDPWVKDIYDNVIASESVIYLVCDGDIMFMINRKDFASVQDYLVDGVRSSVLLALDGNFSMYIKDDKIETEDDLSELTKLLGQEIIEEAFQIESAGNAQA